MSYSSVNQTVSNMNTYLTMMLLSPELLSLDSNIISKERNQYKMRQLKRGSVYHTKRNHKKYYQQQVQYGRRTFDSHHYQRKNN